ncbi:MAG: hypothetical protein AB7P69_21845 [Candidatus Binatia bacterium]
MKVCVLLARQRSGTGALGSVLDQHPSFRYLGEVFHHDAIDRSPNYFHFLKQQIELDPNFALPGSGETRFTSYMERLDQLHPEKLKIVDIKYRSTHHFNGYWHGILEQPALFRLITKFEIPVIHLTRSNYLKTYISGLLADQNKIWHARATDTIEHKYIKIDTRMAIGFIRQTAQEVDFMTTFLKKTPKVVTVDYDELFSADGSLSDLVNHKLQHFLNVSPLQKTKPAFVKQTSDDLREVVENYAELADALRETPFGWMLRG